MTEKWLNGLKEPKLITFRRWAKGSREVLSCTSVFLYNISKYQLGAPAQTWHGWSIEIQSNFKRSKLHRKNQGSNFLGGGFSYRNNVRDQIQFRKERQPQHLKRWFFLKKRPTIFTSTAQVLSDRLNETSWVFPAWKSYAISLSNSEIFQVHTKLLSLDSWCNS